MPQSHTEDPEEGRIIEAAMKRAVDPAWQRRMAETEEAFLAELERRIATGEIVLPPFNLPPLWEA